MHSQEQEMNKKDQIKVDFELGEDVQNESRILQDQLWSTAISDGRAHLSHREMAMLHSSQFACSILDYEIVEDLVSSMHKLGHLLNKLTPETLTTIVEYAFPELGPLVYASIERRAILSTMDLLNKTDIKNSNERDIHDLKNQNNGDYSFSVYVRKRPLLDFEIGEGAYDICTVDYPRGITIHEGKLARTSNQLSMTHHSFVFDHVFNERDDNKVVFHRAMMPLIEWVKKGNNSTFLCFGQTGTGKTYTIYGALEHLSNYFHNIPIRITFYEVHGKKCYDLLNKRNVVNLRSDEFENMHIRGAVSLDLMNDRPDELIDSLREPLALRLSKATERNPISSRSHAVCIIELLRDASSDLKNYHHPIPLSQFLDLKLEQDAMPEDKIDNFTLSDKSRWVPYGKLTLVDLAGSERNYETLKMTAAEHKESALINTDLMALKDCFHVYQSKVLLSSDNNKYSQIIQEIQTKISKIFAPSTCFSNALKYFDDKINFYSGSPFIPYRSSLLTRVLKDCFTQGSDHKTAIIATISPTPIDFQHSLNTLKHVARTSPFLFPLAHSITVRIPKSSYINLNKTPIDKWTTDQLSYWLATAERGRFANLALPPDVDGQKILKLDENSLSQLFSSREQAARKKEEGSTWVVSSEDSSRQILIARALIKALQREHINTTAKKRLHL